MKQNEFPHFFGAWLKQRRKILDLTQAEVSQRAGCTVYALRKIESGERKPSKQLAGLLADALDIPPDIQSTFIRSARGELNIERLPPPSLVMDQVSGGEAPFSPSRLPLYFNPLVGREAELTAVTRLFNNPQCRLLTVTGLGGIGKTRLAVEFASTQQSKFPGGIFYVPLASLNSPDLVVPAIADILQLSFSGPVDPKEQLILHIAHHIRRPGLFILDNMEHLLPSSSTSQARKSPTNLITEMLQRLPSINFFVTSRERLNLQGEWTFELHGLPTPPPVFQDRLEEYSAPLLFIQNARRARADFTLTKEEQPHLARICQLLEGIPLAIELAATWVVMLSCAEIAAEIESNIDFLSTTMRDIPERHRSLRATFDHSWNLLTVEERNTLCQLSIFQAGFNREAAAYIAKATLPIVAALISKSLVRRAENGRFDLHEVIRQFTLSCLLNEPQNVAVRDRHSEYYLMLVSKKEKALKSAAQQEIVSELNVEMDNVRAAWKWAIQRENFALTSHAGRSFSWYFEAAGLLTEGVEQFELLVTALRNQPANRERNKALGQALTQQGLLVFRKGDLDQAQVLWEESLALLRPLENQALLTDTLVLLGIVDFLKGDLERSQRLLEEGLVCAQRSGDEWFTAYAIYNLGYIASLVGRYEEGYEQMMAGMTIWRRLGDPYSIALGLNFLSPTLLKLDRLEEAESNLRESLAFSTSTRNRWGSGTAYRYLGLTKLAQGQPAEAQSLLHTSVEIFSGYTKGWDIANSLICLAQATLASANPPEAESICLEALHAADNVKSIPMILEALLVLAEVKAELAENELAVELAYFVQNQTISTYENKCAARQLLLEAEQKLLSSDLQSAKINAEKHTLETIVQKFVY